MENSERFDVHPYEQAQRFQRLLNVPVYDVAALVEKSGKKQPRLRAFIPFQWITTVAEAFTH